MLPESQRTAAGAGGRLRVLTTTYTGPTEAAALDSPNGNRMYGDWY